tara:strand:- start:61 stop:231 length:171 start_codon:yes stop_codon:yes gene_type:complete
MKSPIDFLMHFIKGRAALSPMPVADATGEYKQAVKSPEASSLGLFGINPNQGMIYK